jgi:ATP-dependent Clp protease adapter protein ClpS
MAPQKTISTNCEKATFLIEKQQATKLSFTEILFLKVHLAGCSVCRIYKRQSVIINQLTHKLFHASANSQSKLDDESKKEMQHRMDEKLGRNKK